MTDELKTSRTKTTVYVPQRPTETECCDQTISTPTTIIPLPATSGATHWPPQTHTYRRVRHFSTAVFRCLLTILALLLIFSGLGFIISISSKEYGATLRSLEATRKQATEIVIASTNASIQGTANTLSTIQVAIESSATAVEQTNNQATATMTQATTTAQDFTTRYRDRTSKQAIFKNDLTQRAGPGGWDTGQARNTKSSCAYQSGHYHATEVYQGYLQPCIAELTFFRDFIYQATITMDKGGESQAGLLFRVNEANTSYYFFSISSNGNYYLDLCSALEGCHTLMQNPQSGPQHAEKGLRPPSSLSPQGVDTGKSKGPDGFAVGEGQSTQLGVMAKGETYTLYANGHYLMSIKDDSLSSGKIGVAVLDTNAPINAVFRSVRVWAS